MALAALAHELFMNTYNRQTYTQTNLHTDKRIII